MDISNLLSTTPAKLDWLDVDEADYRDLDRLPKQNLDVVPDLVAAWSHEDQPPSSYVPNRAGAPRTMGDLSPEHGLLRGAPADIVKVARLLIVQTTDLDKIKNALTQRFDPNQLRAARTALGSVLAERGLLGPYFVDAADFPGCHQGGAKAAAFVKRHAATARFLRAKEACEGCLHAHKLPTGTQTCSVFHKELVVEVPYTDALAEQVEQMEAAKGRQVRASQSAPRERIRLALLAPAGAVEPVRASFKPVENVQRLIRQAGEAPAFEAPIDLTASRDHLRGEIAAALRSGSIPVLDAQAAFRLAAAATTAEALEDVRQRVAGGQEVLRPVYVGQGQAAPPAPEVSQTTVHGQLMAAENLTRKRDEATQRMASEIRARPIVAVLQREMLKGRPEAELSEIMRQVASPVDLQATAAHWQPLLREAGLYGVLYTTQASFDDCHEGASFLATHNPGVKAVVAGAKCAGCIYHKLSRCLVYGKPVVGSAADVTTLAMVETVFMEHKMAGRIAPWDTRLAQGTPREALQTLFRSAARGTGGKAAARTAIDTAFVGGDRTGHSTSLPTRQAIVATARRSLNEGLYGADLGRVLTAQYDVRDIRAAREDLRAAITDQGLQGIYFIDPTVYADYGRGCKEAARIHRARQVPYVKAASKCATCVHRSSLGQCSVLGKELVAEVPYPAPRASLQREILASGAATKNPVEGVVAQSGLALMAEYGLGPRGMRVDVDPTRTAEQVDVSFGGEEIEL